ncbi:MAG: radical SAM family heme chaperone HemW [Clostridiales bacterium]|nr:radical SAM family heme chaperone HemW [Clostridiales bacterium]
MKPVGIYIHIPFCRSFCPYCDFYKVRPDGELMQKYTEAVVNTTASFSHIYGRRPVDTIYFGGGTPSAVPGSFIAEMLQSVRENFDVASDAEITVECNPSSDFESFLPVVSAAGVNRVSLGLQSAADGERRALGRASDAVRVKQAVALVRAAGIENISLDVMLGVPGQDRESLLETLEFCKGLKVPHISAYMLKLEEGTVFFDRKESLDLPSEDEVCDMYELTCDTLEAAGLKQYEISNFAVPGLESRHNLKYWRDEEYLGIGPAAHSFADGRRFFFPSDINAFIAGSGTVDDGPGGSYEERLMLGLRLAEGVSGLPAGFAGRVAARADLAPFIEAGDTSLKLNRRGFLISNRVISEILEMI